MDKPSIIPLLKLERIMILRAVTELGMSRKTAKVLGIGYTTLYTKMKRYKREIEELKKGKP
jgi:DNA-binding NtrC family response regulator